MITYITMTILAVIFSALSNYDKNKKNNSFETAIQKLLFFLLLLEYN